MSTPVMQRTISEGEIGVMQAPFDLRDGAVEPITAMNGVQIPRNQALLPQHEGATSFSLTLDQHLPNQVMSRHQPYFAQLSVEGEPSIPVAVKTYNKSNGSDFWRKEVAALEKARRSGLEALTPIFVVNFGHVALMGTVYIDDLFDLERRFRGEVPEGYEIDESGLLVASAAALAAQHSSEHAGLVNGDAAPRNFAYRGPIASKTPVIIDPETYVFPGERSADEITKLQANDLRQLINESARVIAGKAEGTARVGDGAHQEAFNLANSTIPLIYNNVIGHSF